MTALLAALTLFTATSHAGTDWDWEDEFDSRHWRTASLNWANAIHPSHPSQTWLQANATPPPEELWCHGPPSPSPVDLEIWDDLLKDWMVDYLDLGPNDPIPPTPPFTYEC